MLFYILLSLIKKEFILLINQGMRFFYYLPFFLLAACHQQTTEEKIKNALVVDITNDLAKNGEKVEKISVDSIQYELTSIESYYTDSRFNAQDAQNKLSELYAAKIASIKEPVSDSDKAVVNQMKRSFELPSFINELAKKTDTSVQTYYVKLKWTAQTDKRNISTRDQVYLYKSNLQLVDINFDSLYNIKSPR